jgi:hypothetical protein
LYDFPDYLTHADDFQHALFFIPICFAVFVTERPWGVNLLETVVAVTPEWDRLFSLANGVLD